MTRRGVIAEAYRVSPTARVVLRSLAICAVVIAVATVHIPGRPATFCVLRAVTGIPCPFCGGTTAAVHLGHGDFTGALAASPLAVAMIAAIPFVGFSPRLRSHRRLWRAVIATALVLAELWQLGRFGFLPFHPGI